MDAVTLIYYAAICGLLSLLSPTVKSRPIRFTTGLIVGVGAALLLPTVRASLGV